jgi:PKD repeat protein
LREEKKTFGKNVTTVVMLTLLLMSMMVLAFRIEPASAVVPVYPAIYMEPAEIIDSTFVPGTNFNVSIRTDYGGTDVFGWQFTLAYDPLVLQGVEVINGDLISKQKHSTATFMTRGFDNAEGKLELTGAVFLDTYPMDGVDVTYGPGTLANVTFTVVGFGATNIAFGGGPSETFLQGWNASTPGPMGYGEPYFIIDGETMPDHLGHGYFINVQPIHDVAITSIVAPAVAAQGDIVPINVTVSNPGNYNEIFYVNVGYDTTIIETRIVSLAAKASKTELFSWNTTNVTPATYTLTAEAILTGDEYLANNIKTTTILIESPQVNLPPVAVISAPSSAYEGELVTFDGSGSYDPDGTVVDYMWDFGDGVTGEDEIASHIFQSIGTYEVTLVVTDNEGQVSNSARHNITITKLMPALSVQPTNIINPTLGPGSIFYVNITIADIENLWSYQFILSYDTSILTATNLGSYAPFDKEWSSIINDTAGYVSISYSMRGHKGFSTTDPMPISWIEFTVDNVGTSVLDLLDSELIDTSGNPISHQDVDGLFDNRPPGPEEPFVKVYVAQPLGYIPAQPPGVIVTVDMIIEVSGIADHSHEGIVGWGIYVQVDPDVLKPVGVRGARSGYFLWEFADWWWYDYPAISSFFNNTAGFCDIAEFIAPLPAGGAGDPWSGLKLVTLEFLSKSETAYSLIDLFDIEYMTRDGMWHPVDEVIDGHYTRVPILGDIDGDGDVDRYDYGLFAQAYGTSEGDPNYIQEADLDIDGDIDRYDFGILAQNYGQRI